MDSVKIKYLMKNDKLIDYMVSKGIKFDIVKKDEAIDFLNNNTYYTKISSFRRNYNKNKNNKYVNLDFAYLKDLSTIDMYLRKNLFDICLDIEHYIKIEILNTLSYHNYDGYDIMRLYLNHNKGYNLDSLKKQSRNSYTKDLIENHYPYVPVWVYLECASMGDLISFYKFFLENIKKELPRDFCYFYSVRNIRNAGGHNSCIINNLKNHSRDSGNSARMINSWVEKNIDTIGNRSRNSNLKNITKRDIVITLYIFDKVVTSSKIKAARYKNLKDLFEKRALRNKNYYEKNDTIKSSYNFLKKVIEFFVNK